MARVLVCDDATFMRMTLIRILKEGGHETVGEASDGEQAVNRYKELKPDIVLMDITMPGKMDLKRPKKLQNMTVVQILSWYLLWDSSQRFLRLLQPAQRILW